MLFQKNFQIFIPHFEKDFSCLGFTSVLLSLQPEEWIVSEEYIKGRDRVIKLFETNDAAERGIVITQAFTANGRIKNEDQLQFMIQVAEEHRRK